MPRPTARHRPFGCTPSGEDVGLWRLESGTGVHAEILTYGGILHALGVPDTAGDTASVVLSLPSVDQYAEKSPYFGALIGRYANRIAHGRFTLDGATHHVPVNDRGHALHGGPEGFDTKVWRATPLVEHDSAAVRLSLHSPDGEMGFPGALDVTVTYTLDSSGTLSLSFTAETDRPTVVNLCNHAYFNLAGRGDILAHTLQVDAPAYLPVRDDGIPMGPPLEVSGTPFDLTAPWLLGDRLSAPDDQMEQAGASTTAGSSPPPPPAHSGAPPGSPPRPRNASWRCGRQNQDCRSTPPTSSTARSWTATGAASAATAPCAWRPSTSPTRPTGPTTPAPSCAPARP